MGKRGDGRVIRISQEAFDMLQAKRKRGNFKSWDALIRCQFGLPARAHAKFRELMEFWWASGSQRIFLKQSEARGEALSIAMAEGYERPEPPIKLREVL